MNGVRVRVPATSANLGPGFDCLGCALGLYGDFDCARIDEGLVITGCPEIYQNEKNLFVRAYRLTEDVLGVPHAPIRLHIRTDVPVARGLGSSASLLAAGATAANAMNGDRLSKAALLKICNDIEGHPDNVAPALMGGMCISLVKDGMPVSVPIPVAENVGFVALIPNFETETKAMRAVLPTAYSKADAVFNMSRLGVLIRGFELGDLALIGQAMDDQIHQPYRKHLIYEYDRAERAALDAGCSGFCISGSGSACLGVAALSEVGRIAETVQRALDGSAYAWRVYALPVAEGASWTNLNE